MNDYPEGWTEKEINEHNLIIQLIENIRKHKENEAIKKLIEISNKEDELSESLEVKE